MTTFQEKAYRALRRVPRGRVTTYKDLARTIGSPRAARAVGNALNKNPFVPDVPCHRAVRSDGSVGGYALGARKKIETLRREGIKIIGDRIYLARNPFK